MATLTATLLTVKKTGNKSSEMMNIGQIDLTENSRPALILNEGEMSGDKIVVIPTLENMMDDLLLMVTVYITGGVFPSREMADVNKLSLYEIFTDQERRDLYRRSSEALNGTNIKLFLHIQPESHLFNQLGCLLNFPVEYEVLITRYL